MISGIIREYLPATLSAALAIWLLGCGGRHGPPVEQGSAGAASSGAPAERGETNGVDLSRPLSECPVPPGNLTKGGPVRLDEEQSLRRWGREVSRLDQVMSSLQVPVEVCGVAGQMQWLLAATCPDGSSPFSSADDAHRARVGNAGRGGRCDTIVDLYRIECAGVSHEVHIDLYHCGPSEEFPQETGAASTETQVP